MSSRTAQERMHASLTLVLQRLAVPGTQAKLADACGMNESTISRIKTDRLEDVLSLLAHLDLKVVDAGARCLSPSAYEFLTATHQRVMQQAPQLIWEDSQ